MPLLEARGITVRFGGHLALNDVSFEAEPGCVTGLIGPNGAGKTTLFNVISGLQPPAGGTIYIDGHDVTKLSPSRRARRGLARTFQRLELFTQLSVRENLSVAAEIHRGWSSNKENPAKKVAAMLERVGLSDVADERVTSLPTGQGRLVELGRALCCDPKVLLLDEPASGQDDEESARFAQLLLELAADDLAVVLVEHDVPLVMRVCDRVSVLDFGSILASGTPSEVQANAEVLTAYLGEGMHT